MIKIKYMDVVDWEPAVLRFHFSNDPGDELSYFERFAEAFLRSNARKQCCRCKYRFSEFYRDIEGAPVELRTEWLCRNCAQALVDQLCAHFPLLARVELGLTAAKPIEDLRQIRIPARAIKFEDGTSTVVEP